MTDFLITPTGQTWCQTCGALIHDTDAHRRWHERTDA